MDDLERLARAGRKAANPWQWLNPADQEMWRKVATAIVLEQQVMEKEQHQARVERMR